MTMVHTPVERDSMLLQRQFALFDFCFALLFIVFLVGAGIILPFFLATDGYWLQAMVPAVIPIIALAEMIRSGFCQSIRLGTGWLLERLGARRKYAWFDDATGPVLRIDTGLGPYWVPLHRIPFVRFQGAESTTLQYGSTAVAIHTVDHSYFFIQECSKSVAQTLAARLLLWRHEVRTEFTAPDFGRCAICDIPFGDDRDTVKCAACGAESHRVCDLELGGRCATIGCSRGLEATATGDDRIEEPIDRRHMPAAGSILAWLFVSGIAAVLLLRGMASSAKPFELEQGLMVGVVSLLPLVIRLAVGGRTALVDEILTPLLGGSRVLQVDRSSGSPMLRIAWHKGPIWLTTRRVPLEAIEMIPEQQMHGSKYWALKVREDLSKPPTVLWFSMSPARGRRMQEFVSALKMRPVE